MSTYWAFNIYICLLLCLAESILLDIRPILQSICLIFTTSHFLWVFNSIRPLLSSAQPFDLREHLLVVQEADDCAYCSFLIPYFKMSNRVITQRVLMVSPYVDTRIKTHTHTHPHTFVSFTWRVNSRLCVMAGDIVANLSVRVPWS